MDFLELCRFYAQKHREHTLTTISDLDEKDFAWQPRHDANSIAWILWHIGEVEESILWVYYQQKPVFRFQKSVLKSDPKHLPSKDALLEYLSSTRTAYFALIDSIKPEQVDKPIESKLLSTTTVGELLLTPIHHEIMHSGQIAYIRRLLGKPYPNQNAANPFQ